MHACKHACIHISFLPCCFLPSFILFHSVPFHPMHPYIHTYGQTYTQAYVHIQIGRQAGSLHERPTDRPTDRHTNGSTDGSTDGDRETYMHICTHYGMPTDRQSCRHADLHTCPHVYSIELFPVYAHDPLGRPSVATCTKVMY